MDFVKNKTKINKYSYQSIFDQSNFENFKTYGNGEHQREIAQAYKVIQEKP